MSIVDGLVVIPAVIILLLFVVVGVFGFFIRMQRRESETMRGTDRYWK